MKRGRRNVFPSYFYKTNSFAIKKILVIRFSSIGDIILTSPVIRALKKQLAAELHFLCKSTFSSLMKYDPHIDRHWIYSENKASLLKQLKNENFDLVVDLQKNFLSRKLVGQLSAKYVSFDKTNINKWLHVNFKYPPLKNRHIVDRYFDALAHVGVTNDGLGLAFYLNPAEEKKSVPPASFYLCIALGAAHATKQIPDSIIMQMCDQLQTKIFLLGGAQDFEKGERIAKGRPMVNNLAGKLSFHESAIKLKGAKLLITGDTGLMHMAVGLSVPTVVLWGNTVPEFGMSPYYGNRERYTKSYQVKNLACRPCSKLGKPKCPKGHFDCMKKQDTDLIIEQIRSFIED